MESVILGFFVTLITFAASADDIPKNGDQESLGVLKMRVTLFGVCDSA